ncbi:IS1 family transposase, partial [Tannerella forsythia]|uniref:IS1 family transposase n=1 Tax=Tannerella forsythia TaxID=28112 RepID=UPI003F80658B
GIIKEKQRYKCKNCGCNYTVEMKSTAKPKSMKKQALHLYLEGLGFRSIGRILGVSNVSVLNWIRDFGHKVQELSSQNQDIEMVELDEMHSYIGSKKNFCWIWIAVDRYGKRFINFFIGDRSNETAKEFWETIKHHQMDSIASDYWKPYESIIPKEKHIQSKAETFTVEGYNSLFRHFLARMRRKTKCYSKKMEMLKLSILLLMHHRNGSLYILS